MNPDQPVSVRLLSGVLILLGALILVGALMVGLSSEVRFVWVLLSIGIPLMVVGVLIHLLSLPWDVR